jgi:hypothetical protein
METLIKLTPCSRSLLEKLMFTQLVRIFLTFYETRRFVNLFVRPPPLVPTVTQMQSLHTFPPRFPKIYSNIILPATGWTIRVLGFDSRRGLGIFLITTVSRTALETTQPPIQRVPGALSVGVKRPGREGYHLPLSSAEVKNAWSCTSISPLRLHGVVLS